MHIRVNRYLRSLSAFSRRLLQRNWRNCHWWPEFCSWNIRGEISTIWKVRCCLQLCFCHSRESSGFPRRMPQLLLKSAMFCEHFKSWRCNRTTGDLCLHLGSVGVNVESAAGVELSPTYKSVWNTSVSALSFSVQVKSNEGDISL